MAEKEKGNYKSKMCKDWKKEGDGEESEFGGEDDDKIKKEKAKQAKREEKSDKREDASDGIPGLLFDQELAKERSKNKENGRRKRAEAIIQKNKDQEAEEKDEEDDGWGEENDGYLKENKGEEKGKPFKNTMLEAQIEESRKQLDDILNDGEILITNVKIAAEYREKTRQIRDETNRNERLKTLKEEAEEAQKLYDEISQKWFLNAEKVLPLELFEQIDKQKRECDKLLQKKEETIERLKQEIDDNDMEYESNLDKYQKDIMLMGDRIDNQIDNLRRTFLEELELIENYTVDDREKLLEEFQKDWMNLLCTFEGMEVDSLNKRKEDSLGRFDILTQIQFLLSQESREIKNMMEEDMRTLFQELEGVKGACQANLDKLDYNLNVLRHRMNENNDLKNNMKRLMMKKRDNFHEKAKIFRDTVANGKRETERLIRETKRLEELVLSDREKTLHSVATNFRNYMDLWAIKEEAARKKLEFILNSESKVIVKQLGHPYVPSKMSSLDDRPPEVQFCLVNTNPKMEGIPTKDEVIDYKINKFQFPSHNAVEAYWRQFHCFTETKSKEFWIEALRVFDQYGKMLKGRNECIEEITNLFRKNYELSHLLRQCLRNNGCTVPFSIEGCYNLDPQNLNFCGVDDGNEANLVCRPQSRAQMNEMAQPQVDE